MGLRVRLKRGVNISGLPYQARVVAQALKRYGMILADNGSPWYISGAPDRHWNNDALHLLDRLSGKDFEVVEHQLAASPRPVGRRFAQAPGGRIGAAASVGVWMRCWRSSASTGSCCPPRPGRCSEPTSEVARTRLRELTDAGHLIEQPVLVGQPVAYRSTRLGLDVVGSRLRSLPISLTNYWHDVGAAWLWLAARNGAFGPMREVLAERVIRSRDGQGT